MALSKSLRCKGETDFKKLNEGSDLPRELFKKRAVDVKVLPETYSVERIMERSKQLR